MVAAAQVDGVERVRLSSVEVIHVKDSLLEALATEPKVCPHLHVPMQSGDDGVLARDGPPLHLRRVPRAHRSAARGSRRAVNVTTDVIVGFPTEDEAAFERTLAAVDAAGITRVHVFPYSPRPGTVAAELGDRVPPQEKKRRSAALRGHSRSARATTAPPSSGGASACWSTRSPTRSARATPPTTRAATCRRARRAAARLLDVALRGAARGRDALPAAVPGTFRDVDAGAILEGDDGHRTGTQRHDQRDEGRRESSASGALRLVLSELQKAAKDGDGDELAVLRRERKRRLEAAAQFRDGGRPELADQEESEAKLIDGYLPAELDDAELDAIVDAAIAETGRERAPRTWAGDEGRDGERPAAAPTASVPRRVCGGARRA